MQLSKDGFLHYLHYFVLVVALSVCLYIAYSKFIYSEPSSKKGYIPFSSDTTQTINPEFLPDSDIKIPPGTRNIPVPEEFDKNNSSSENKSSEKSNSAFQPRSNKQSEDVKTWMELIIDLLETLTPLLLPVISYYFKPNSTNET